MSIGEFKSRKELYEYHIEEFKKYSGSASKYCVEHNLDPSKFSYYKSYQSQKVQKAKAFAAVSVKPEGEPPQSQKTTRASSRTVDPEWLAEFIHRLWLK